MTFWTRRFIYLIFAAALSIPLVFRFVVPPDVGAEARLLYEAIERVPPDKIILIGQEYEGGTIAENGPQTRALLVHCMKSGKRFALIGWDPVGPGLGQEIADGLKGEPYYKPYGSTWVNFGYKPMTAAILKGFAQDIPGTIKQDIKNNPVAKLPVMRGIQTAKDIGLVIDVTPTASYVTWIGYFTGVYKVPFGVAPTSVMIADIYPYFNSGQVVGMLKGIAGAAQYEKLVGAPDKGYTNRMPVFMAHVTIILLILFGNAMDIRRRIGGAS